jgi:hypothetical protein
VQAVVSIAGAGLVRVSERAAEVVATREGADRPVPPAVVGSPLELDVRPPAAASLGSAVSRAPPFPA